MAMSRRIGILRELPVAVVLICGAFASPAIADPPGSACSKQSVSALDQYCENIPSATGPQTPGAGTQAVGNGLPPAVARALTARRSSVPLAVRRELRALPAAARHHTRRLGKRDTGHDRQTTGTVSAANVWSLSLTLILILVGVALGLLAVATERWRRGRSKAGGPPTAPSA
jgi:hypothetical protein